MAAEERRKKWYLGVDCLYQGSKRLIFLSDFCLVHILNGALKEPGELSHPSITPPLKNPPDFTSTAERPHNSRWLSHRLSKLFFSAFTRAACSFPFPPLTKLASLLDNLPLKKKKKRQGGETE